MFESDHWIVISGEDQVVLDNEIDWAVKASDQNKRTWTKKDRPFQGTRESITCGLRGEFALSRYLRLDRAKVSADTAQTMSGDLELGIEVKASDKPNGNLYCSEKKLSDYLRRSPNTPVVLAITSMWPAVEFHGFIFAKELHKHPFTRTDIRQNAGFLVLRQKLRSIDELRELVFHWRNYKFTSNETHIN